MIEEKFMVKVDTKEVARPLTCRESMPNRLAVAAP